MAEKTSIQVYEWWMEAVQKFDYFMAGISTALAGYLGQNFRPERLGLSPGLLELFSILFFVGATVASLKRIESTVVALSVNLAEVEVKETAGSLAEALRLQMPVRYSNTGEEVAPEALRQAHNSQKEAARLARETLSKVQRRAQHWYATRTYLLVGGFLCLIGARVWQAYL